MIPILDFSVDVIPSQKISNQLSLETPQKKSRLEGSLLVVLIVSELILQPAFIEPKFKSIEVAFSLQY